MLQFTTSSYNFWFYQSHGHHSCLWFQDELSIKTDQALTSLSFTQIRFNLEPLAMVSRLIHDRSWFPDIILFLQL